MRAQFCQVRIIVRYNTVKHNYRFCKVNITWTKRLPLDSETPCLNAFSTNGWNGVDWESGWVSKRKQEIEYVDR